MNALQTIVARWRQCFSSNNHHNVTVIAAVDDYWGMGVSNKLPWPRVKCDMEYFRDTTYGGVLIMGRKTFDSLNGLSLDGRIIIVVSSQDRESTCSNLMWATSLTDALDKAAYYWKKKPVWIAGGADIYGQVMFADHKIAGAALITRIPGAYDCDTHFPYDLDRNVGLSDHGWCWHYEGDHSIGVDKDGNPVIVTMYTTEEDQW